MTSKHIDLLDFSELPAPVYFRYADFDAHRYASAHRHPWGTLEYSAHGVLHMEIGGSRFMSPPQYAVWVPPADRAQLLQQPADQLSRGLPGASALP